ncbi:MAG TPA: hypothetical protein PLG17_06425 [Thermodesulfobacteriota bacterium]|nr:hypothetical protein [Thermodesulfobacteriota bacterium]
MNKRIVVNMMCISLFLSLSFGAVFFASAQTQGTDECRVVMIEGMEIHRSLRLQPPGPLTISKGTCVVWFNRQSASEVRISFSEGKKCDNITDAARGFQLTGDGCYATDAIPFGGTASLRFLEEGEYTYELKGPEVGQGVQTSIIVK